VPPNEAAGYQFSYTVLNDDVVNAFALPGGPIYISKGLLFRLNNEAELAFVLGHETGHVVAQHVGRQMSKSTEAQLLLAGVGAAVGGKDAGTSGQLAQAASQFADQMYLLKYSREEESQADLLGIQYLVAAGYDPRASIAVMQILEKASGGKGGADWFSTHPSSANRVKELQDLIQQKYPQTVNNPSYQLQPGPFQQNVLRQRTEGLRLNVPGDPLAYWTQ